MPQPPRARQPLAPSLAPLAPPAAVRSPGAPAASFSAVGAFAAAVSILGAAGRVLRRPAQTTESGLETELMPAVFTVTPEDLPSPQTRKVSALKAELPRSASASHDFHTCRDGLATECTVLYCGLIGRGEYLTFIIMGRAKLRTFFAGVLRALP